MHGNVTISTTDDPKGSDTINTFYKGSSITAIDIDITIDPYNIVGIAFLSHEDNNHDFTAPKSAAATHSIREVDKRLANSASSTTADVPKVPGTCVFSAISAAESTTVVAVFRSFGNVTVTANVHSHDVAKTDGTCGCNPNSAAKSAAVVTVLGLHWNVTVTTVDSIFDISKVNGACCCNADVFTDSKTVPIRVVKKSSATKNLRSRGRTSTTVVISAW